MRSSNRAFALPLTLMTLAVVVVVAGGLVSLGAFGLRAAAADAASTRAFYAAEAGVASCIDRLYADRTWRGPLADQSLGDATYSATVDNNVMGLTPLRVADGTTVPPACARIVSSGRVGGAARTVKVVVARRVTQSDSPFLYAAVGISGIVGSPGGPSRIDAYTSIVGNVVPAGASVVTLSRSTSALALGETEVTGQAILGFKAPSLSLAGLIDGGTVALQRPLHFGPPEAPFDPAPPTNGPMRVSGVLSAGAYRAVAVPPNQSLVLQGGDYYFTGGLTLGRNARLVVPFGSSARVYFDGTFDASAGRVVNNNLLPSSLLVAGTVTATQVLLTGGSQARMVVYAPTAAVSLSGDLQGQVTASTLGLGDHTSLHWDVTLMLNPPDLGPIVTYDRRSYDVAQ